MRKSLLTTITVAILVAFASEGYAQVIDQPTQKKYQAKPNRLERRRSVPRKRQPSVGWAWEVFLSTVAVQQ
jgi:hypothetical protein